jgi:hypothetical protein
LRARTLKIVLQQYPHIATNLACPFSGRFRG